jgi:hypothetical protein
MMFWRALSIGFFLITLGLGWFIFNSIQVTLTTFAWVLLIAGAALIIVALVSWKKHAWPVRRIAASILGGLIISMMFSGGFALLRDFGGTGFWFYTAHGTKTFNGQATANTIYLQIDNFNGPIRLSTWNSASYSINLTARAGGTSQTNADDKLASFNPTLDKTTTDNVYNLIFNYNIPITERSSYTIEVDALLPSTPMLNLNLHSSNGPITLTNIKGNTITAETSNAPLTLNNLNVSSVTAQTSNGPVDGTLQAANIIVRTTNGKIDLTIPSTMTEDIELSTSNGPIDLHVSNPTQAGYSLDTSTSNGPISLDLPNLNYTVDQKTTKQAKTIGFNNKTIQITISAATSNGSININTD